MLAVSLSIALHAVVLAAAVRFQENRGAFIPRRLIPTDYFRGPIHLPRGIATSGATRGPPRAAMRAVSPKGDVQLPESEIIALDHGVTMTIEAESPDAGAPQPQETWLSLEVRVDPPPFVPPRPKFCSPEQPRIPKVALDNDIEGRVNADFVVDDMGVVVQISIAPGANAALARSVREWLQGCLFTPAEQGGRRAAATVHRSWLFELR